jgi:hypothetical protein
VSKTTYERRRIRIGEVKKVLIQMGLIEIADFCAISAQLTSGFCGLATELPW